MSGVNPSEEERDSLARHAGAALDTLIDNGHVLPRAHYQTGPYKDTFGTIRAKLLVFRQNSSVQHDAEERDEMLCDARAAIDTAINGYGVSPSMTYQIGAAIDTLGNLRAALGPFRQDVSGRATAGSGDSAGVPRLPSMVAGDIEADYRAVPLTQDMQVALAAWESAGGVYSEYREDGVPRVKFRFDGDASAAERNHLLDLAHRIGAAATVATVIETAYDPDPNDQDSGPLRPFHRSTADRFIGPTPELRAEVAQETLTDECMSCVNNQIGPRLGDRDDPVTRRRGFVEEHLVHAHDWARAPDWVAARGLVDVDNGPRINLGDCGDRWKYLAIRALDEAQEDLGEPLDLPYEAVFAHANPDAIAEQIAELEEEHGNADFEPLDINTMAAGLALLEKRYRDDMDAMRRFYDGFEGVEQAITYDSLSSFRTLLHERCGVSPDHTTTASRGDEPLRPA